MNRHANILVAIVIAALVVAAPSAAHAAKPSTQRAGTATAKKTGHLEVNGVNYYYEVRGTGEPLLLLHGGLGSIDMFGPNLPSLLASTSAYTGSCRVSLWTARLKRSTSSERSISCSPVGPRLSAGVGGASAGTWRGSRPRSQD